MDVNANEAQGKRIRCLLNSPAAQWGYLTRIEPLCGSNGRTTPLFLRFLFIRAEGLISAVLGNALRRNKWYYSRLQPPHQKYASLGIFDCKFFTKQKTRFC